MRSLTTIDTDVCRPLQEDPELAEAVDPELRADAIALVARQLEISPGSWPGIAAGLDGIGMLVLQGVLALRVGIAGRHSAELVGEGDLLRRPDEQWANSQLTLTHSWLVLEPVRIAVLDGRFSRQMVNFPNLTEALFARCAVRTRQLAVNMAIVHQARVDVRLHMLLWHLAGRWGRVRSDGIVVPLRLTHSILAELVAARRPTVTSALSELSRNGLVRSVPEGWLLSGPPPGGHDALEPNVVASVLPTEARE